MKIENKSALIRKLIDAADKAGYLENILTEFNNQLSQNNKSLTEKNYKAYMRKIENYFSECITECETFTTLNGIKPLQLTQLRKRCKQYTDGKSMRWMWYPSQQHLQFFIEHQKGNNIDKQMTQATINNVYVDSIAEHIVGATPESIPVEQRAVAVGIARATQVNILTTIDRDLLKRSLQNGFYYRYADSKGQLRTAQLEMRHTRQIAQLLKDSNADGELLQQFTQGQTGRLYNSAEQQSPTLLSMSRVVRNIAAPQHTMVDINTSCFAVFLAVANHGRLAYPQHGFARDEFFPYVSKYVENTDRVRTEVTTRVWNSFISANPELNLKPLKFVNGDTSQYKEIKGAFAAIGFGATTASNRGTWYENGKLVKPALTEILGEGKVEHFVNDPFVKEFIAEYEYMRRIITLMYTHSELGGGGKAEVYNEVILPNRSDSQRLAYIYQSFERQLLDIMYGAVTKLGETVKCVIHDGVMLGLSPRKLDIKYAVETAIRNELVITLPDGTMNRLANKIEVSVENFDLAALNQDTTTNVSPAQTIISNHHKHIIKEESEATSTSSDNNYSGALYKAPVRNVKLDMLVNAQDEYDVECAMRNYNR